jgi:cytosine/uracil/thiamine/allantoin permease
MEEQNQSHKINLQKHLLPKASKFFIIKYFFYSLVLAILLYLIFSKFDTMNPEKEKIIDENAIEIELRE